MAIFIKNNSKRSVIWHLGQPVPTIVKDEGVDNINHIVVDGDELANILAVFVNLPCYRFDDKKDYGTRAYTMTWYGDQAKFIVSNFLKT